MVNYYYMLVYLWDGMQLKPGMQFDETQGLIVGTSKRINITFIKENPSPSGPFLRKLLIQRANVCILNSLDYQLHLPVGVDYLTSMNAEETN